MRSRVPRRVAWPVAIVLAYCGLVAIAYAVGPATSSGCSIGGHGRITTAGGDQASFSLLAGGRPPRGAVLYRDDGPSHALHLRAANVTGITCGATGPSASVAGQGTLLGAGSTSYRVVVDFASATAGRATFRITLGNGYDSGAQQIRHAVLAVHAGSAQRSLSDPDAAQNQGAPPDGQ
jgi:hypothetical protein